MSTISYRNKLCMGEGTYEIPLELFALNRRRLVTDLKAKNVGNAIVILQGGDEVPFYDTDITYNVFRQESYFMWTFGVLEAECFGAVAVDTGKSYLFIPRFDPSYAVWMGPLWTIDDFRKKYAVDAVHYVDEIADVLGKLKPNALLTLCGTNSDSKLSSKEANFEGIDKFTINKEVLYDTMANLRVIKTPLELGVMTYVTEVSSAAHRHVMRFVRPKLFEYQCESEFFNYVYSKGGCRHVSYTCICGSGFNGAVLHYGHAGAPNDKKIADGDMLLYDMGGNYFGYAADITCSYPANGKFTADQKLIYEAVLASNVAVFAACKPGVSWVDMHKLSVRVLLTKLRDGGVIRGDDVEQMLNDGLGAIFMPHGLGHLIGLDVHDVGSYLPNQPLRPTEPRGLNKLRMARLLQEGMCLTIEPGCYFIDPLLDEALADPKLSKYMIPDVIKRFRRKGGVRIEDDVVITATGCHNMTRVPRTVKEIEDWIALKDDGKY